MPGFVLSSLPLLPFLYVTQHLYGPSMPASLPQPSIVSGLEAFALCGDGRPSSASMAVTEDAERLLIKCAGATGEQHSTTAAALLSRQQRDGLRFLELLTEEVGWSVVLVDFHAGNMVVATDAYASRPVYVAAGPVTDCQYDNVAECPPPGEEHFAVSSHRSVLERLGFPSVVEVGPASVHVYQMSPPPRPTLTESYSLQLQSFVKPAPPGSVFNRGGGGATSPDAAESRFTVSLKRALGKILRHPATSAGGKGEGSSNNPDRPRFHLFLHGGPHCANQGDPILGALASLPLPFVIYVASRGGEALTRIWYEREDGDRRVTKTEDLDIAALAQPLLSRAEP